MKKAPEDERWLIDEKTGEYISPVTGKRYRPVTARGIIANLKKTKGVKRDN